MPTEVGASICCDRHCECGVSIPSTCVMCDSCHNKKLEQDETERFQKAGVIDLVDWNGPVYSPNTDEYYSALDDLLEGNEADHLPEYVWPCDAIEFVKVDIGDILDQIQSEGYEDFDADDLNGIDDLKAAIELFNERNKGQHLYQPNYSKVILIEKGNA